LLGLCLGLTTSGCLGGAADKHGSASASGVCRGKWLELRRGCFCLVHSGRVALD